MTMSYDSLGYFIYVIVKVMGSNCITEEGLSHFTDEVSKPEKYIADLEL